MSARQKIIVLAKLLVEEQLGRLNTSTGTNRWSIVPGKGEDEEQIQGKFKFKDYTTTWKFLNSVARRAQAHKHHPTIVTTYNKAEMIITTHDIGNKISYKDLRLALAIEQEYTRTLLEGKNSLEPKSALKLLDASKIISELVNMEEKKE